MDESMPPSAVDESISASEPKPKNHHRAVVSITFFIATIILGLLFTFYYSSSQQNNNEAGTALISPAPTITAQPTTAPTESPLAPEQLGVQYKKDSQYNNYKIDLQEGNEQLTYELFIAQPVSTVLDRTLCPIGVVEIKSRREIDMLPFNEVDCQLGIGGYSPMAGFMWGWLNGHEYIIQHSFGELTAYHVNGTNRRALSYDASKYVVEKGNENGTEWLAVTRSSVSSDYLVPDYESGNIFILDTGATSQDNGTTVTTYNFGAGFLRDLTYDNTNNGFFIIREFDSPLAETTEEYNMGYEAARTYTTHWIDAENLAIHDVQTIGPVPIGGGRGCEGGKFSSSPGTITYTGLDCFTLPEGVGENDTLTFTLPKA